MACLFAACLLGACATGPAGNGSEPNEVPVYQKFVSEPSRLQPVASAPGALSWQAAETNAGNYRSVALEHVRVRIAAGSEAESVDPADLKRLADQFHHAIAKALGNEYPLVDKVGPDVLQIRIVIYDLEPTSAATSAVVMFTPDPPLPEGSAGTRVMGGKGASPYLGHSGIAVQFLDGHSGHLIGEYVNPRFGREYAVDSTRASFTAMAEGVSNYGKTFTTWDAAGQAFDAWAKQLRKRLDRDRTRSSDWGHPRPTRTMQDSRPPDFFPATMAPPHPRS